MFSSKKQLIKRTGKHGIGRLNYLQQLVDEYKSTKSRDAKEQVIANLANFAYDPVNYNYLWRLRVLDLFFSSLESQNRKIVSFAIGGICNICLDPLHKQYILRNDGIKIISSLLSSSEESIILSSITTLMYLNTPNSKNLIASPSNVDRMLEFSKSTNRRIKNLANIFLEDLCQIKVKESTLTTNLDINVGASTSVQTNISSTSALKSKLNVGASSSSETDIASTSAFIPDLNAGPSSSAQTDVSNTDAIEAESKSRQLSTAVETTAGPSGSGVIS